MSTYREFEGMRLRQGEVELLVRARRERALQPGEVVAIIERLGRTRAERESDPNWRARYEEGRALLLKREDDLRMLIAEMKRVKEERDDAKLMYRNEMHRRMAAERRVAHG